MTNNNILYLLRKVSWQTIPELNPELGADPSTGQVRELTTYEYERSLFSSLGEDCVYKLHKSANYLYVRTHFERAAEALAAALYIAPCCDQTINALGVVMYAQRLRRGAVATFKTSLHCNPKNAYAILNQTQCLIDLKQYQEAIGICQSITEHPDLAGLAHLTLSECWGILHQNQAALFHAKAAYLQMQDNPYARLNCAHFLMKANHLEEACDVISQLNVRAFCGDKSLRSLSSYLNCILALGNEDMLVTAIKELPPTYFAMINGNQYLALAARRLGNREKWRAFMVMSLRQDPYDTVLRAQNVVLLLEEGDLRKAFTYYEWRHSGSSKKGKIRGILEQLCLPLWDGRPDDQCRLLVHGEQGIGDQIMFSRFLSGMKRKVGNAVVSVDTRLVPICHRSFPELKFVDIKAPFEPEFSEMNVNSQILMGSVGRYCGPSHAKFVKRTSYLVARHDLATSFRRKYKNRFPEHLLVGISWHSENERLREKKNPPKEVWKEVFSHCGLAFINLQYGREVHQMDSLALDYGADLYADPEVDQMLDMDSFFAQVQSLDLIITIANTALHVAGALGKNTWLIISSDLPLLSGASNDGRLVLYPSVEVYEKSGTEKWASVFSRISKRLAQFIAERERLKI